MSSHEHVQGDEGRAVERRGKVSSQEHLQRGRKGQSSTKEWQDYWRRSHGCTAAKEPERELSSLITCRFVTRCKGF